MMAHPIVCISGTDTGAGKTVLAAGLLRALTLAGVDAQAVKAVQTGCPIAPDETSGIDRKSTRLNSSH